MPAGSSNRVNCHSLPSAGNFCKPYEQSYLLIASFSPNSSLTDSTNILLPIYALANLSLAFCRIVLARTFSPCSLSSLAASIQSSGCTLNAWSSSAAWNVALACFGSCKFARATCNRQLSGYLLTRAKAWSRAYCFENFSATATTQIESFSFYKSGLASKASFRNL